MCIFKKKKICAHHNEKPQSVQGCAIVENCLILHHLHLYLTWFMFVYLEIMKDLFEMSCFSWNFWYYA